MRIAHTFSGKTKGITICADEIINYDSHKSYFDEFESGDENQNVTYPYKKWAYKMYTSSILFLYILSKCMSVVYIVSTSFADVQKMYNMCLYVKYTLFVMYLKCIVCVCT